MGNKRYYEILGISQSASDEEVRKAYKRMALKYHPDKNDHPQAEEYFKEIVIAFETLSDKEKRYNYDNDKDEGEQGRQSTCAQPSSDSLPIICAVGVLLAFAAFKTVQHFTKKPSE